MTALYVEPIAPVINAPMPPTQLGITWCEHAGCQNCIRQLSGLLFMREKCALHAGMQDWTNLLTAHPIFTVSLELHNLCVRLRRRWLW